MSRPYKVAWMLRVLLKHLKGSDYEKNWKTIKPKRSKP